MRPVYEYGEVVMVLDSSKGMIPSRKEEEEVHLPSACLRVRCSSSHGTASPVLRRRAFPIRSASPPRGHRQASSPTLRGGPCSLGTQEERGKHPSQAHVVCNARLTATWCSSAQPTIESYHPQPPSGVTAKSFVHDGAMVCVGLCLVVRV